MNLNGTQGSPYQGLTQTRPYDFGTDAIERQRVSLGVSLIDADFEYGIQATKWQSYSDIRKTPSFFEIPGTDVPLAAGASAVTSGGGAYSTITVTTTINSVLGTSLSAQYSGTGAATTSAILYLNSYIGLAVGQCVIIAGITGLAVVSASPSPPTVTLTIPSQTVPSIAAGTTINFYNPSAAATTTCSFTGPITGTGATLTVVSSAGVANGQYVIVAGITGPVIVTSFIGTSVTVSFPSQTVNTIAALTTINFYAVVVSPTISAYTGTGSSGTSVTLSVSSTTSLVNGQYASIAGITGSSGVTVASFVANPAVTVTYPSQIVPTIAATTVPITFYSAVVPNVGSVVSVSGLANSDNTANRAEGFFLVNAVTQASPAKFTYIAKTGATTGTNIATSYTLIRRGNVYNNGYARVPAPAVAVTSGTVITVTTTNAHGLTPATPISVFGWTGTTVAAVNGNYLIQSVPSAITFTYATTGATGTGLTGGFIYVQPYSYTIHRPFDGGVILSPNIPTHGALAARQSKKVFRYQSGKGLLWSSGTLFCPNNDIVSLAYSAGVITVTTSVPHGAPQAGATVQIRGVTSTGYNGTFTVGNVTGDTVLTLNTTNAIAESPATLGDQPRFIMTNWHGSSVRAGCFDDQNGLFWEYDGQTLWVVKRSCTFQLAGSVTMTAASGASPTTSQVVTGVNGVSRFLAQLKVNDKITIRGMTYQVTGISNDYTMTVNPPYRGSDITLGVTACKVREVRTPQSLFNRDTIDGRGASGYTVDLSKMQMIGLQYTWYGAGFVDFMIRGSDGNWIYAHRIRNNNVNDEAYMRTGNLPVRYEICNESTSAVSSLVSSMASGDTVTTLALNDATTYWPTSGTVLIDQELFSYTGKTATALTGVTRTATLSYNISDTTFSGFAGSAAAAHSASASVNLISCTCSPSITHWGSALLMDGNFDSDRGYFFNYQVNSVSAVAQGTTINLFMLRLAPSVSNGVVGDMGTRDLLNRAQLLLQRLDLFGGSTLTNGSSGSVVVSGILNPSGLTVSSWTAINSTANGSQPSFAQVASSSAFSGSYIAGSGERIFSTICNNGQNSIDLSNLKEVCNGTIGGNQMFPDGPDTLLVQLSVPSGFPALASYSVNLFWTEAQA